MEKKHPSPTDDSTLRIWIDKTGPEQLQFDIAIRTRLRFAAINCRAADYAPELRGRRIVTGDKGRAEENRAAACLAGWEVRGNVFARIYFHDSSNSSSQNTLQYALQPTSTLMSLPVEIRLRILEYAMTPNETNETWKRTPSTESWIQKNSGFNLIYACRQLHIESLPFALSEFTVKEWELPWYRELWNLIEDIELEIYIQEGLAFYPKDGKYTVRCWITGGEKEMFKLPKVLKKLGARLLGPDDDSYYLQLLFREYEESSSLGEV